MAYGLLNLAIWVLPLISINRKPFMEEHPAWYAFLSGCFLVISPALLAWIAVWLRNTRLVSSRVGHPNKTAWDDFFKRRQECWILFHLKDGKMLGGYFGEKSYVSTFPQQPEIYVEEVWRVDDRGAFLEKVEGTLGTVIRQADCDRLEFLVVEGDNTNGTK